MNRSPVFAAALSLTVIGAMALLPPGTPPCSNPTGLPTGWGKDAHAGMVLIPAGEFELGSTRGYSDEQPLQARRLAAFWMDRTEVSNAQFASFVAATGYVTDAERGAGAAVFRSPEAAEPGPEGSWWHLERTATWRHPEGADSTVEDRGSEPVVNVTYADALAYARWLGRDLPDEAQWEYAAKAGRDRETADRSLRDAQGRPQANFWQGLFPLQNQVEDGYRGRAPVGCFAANPFGLQDMVGNVWEWTREPYTGGHAAHAIPEAARLPEGAPGTLRRVIKGGSYLCSDNYCVRARASSRQGQEADLPTAHLGFRTVSAR